MRKNRIILMIFHSIQDMYDRYYWQGLGRKVTLSGHQIFYIDEGRSDEVILVLHGFPTSSFDFKDVLRTLKQKYRVIIPDHLGFGFSDKPHGDYSYSLVEQAQKIVELCQVLKLVKINVIAHDYGTSILTELLALNQSGELPIKLQKIILCNGSMLIHMAQLRPIQRLLRLPVLGPIIGRLSNKAVFRRNLKKILARPEAISESEISDMWDMIIINDGKRVIPKISRYTFERVRHYDRWIGALSRTQAEVLILWGMSDPVALADMAIELRNIISRSIFRSLPGLGHYPMLEDPHFWVQEVMDFLESDFEVIKRG